MIMPEDFIKFGLIPEFIGRVPVVVTLDALDEKALISILKEPKNSLTKQYHKLFELDGVELDFQDDAAGTGGKEISGTKDWCQRTSGYHGRISDGSDVQDSF